MGLWGDFKVTLKDFGLQAWDELKEGAKREAKRMWEDFKADYRRRTAHLSAPIPDDIAQVLKNTPDSEVPVIPYRKDTVPFLTDYLTDEDHERGWAHGQVHLRPVRIIVPPKDVLLKELVEQDIREWEEKANNTEVPRDVLKILKATPEEQDPVIPFRAELTPFVVKYQDSEEVLRQGFSYGKIRGRRVRFLLPDEL